MSLKDIVLEYYKKENNNSCSEAMIKGCNDYYHLNLSNDVFLASSAFSKGMYGGHVCGAIASGAAVIGILHSNGYAHDSDKMRALVARLHAECNARICSNKCLEIRDKYFNPENRCASAVGMVADILEEILEDNYLENLKNK